MQFEKVKQAKFQRKSSYIADQILRMIKTGRYKAGAKLPPERLLAEQMEVGRPSVREAISALQIVGILESRPGEGSFLAKPQSFDALMARALNVLEESDSPFEVLNVRKAIEIGVVYLAVKTATEEDIREIKAEWNEKYEKGRKGDYVGFIGHGRQFHLAIARATKSKAIEAVMDELLKITDQALWVNMRQGYFKKDPTRIEPILELHAGIVQAIEVRNALEAVRLMELHFDLNLQQHYEEYDDPSPSATATQ